MREARARSKENWSAAAPFPCDLLLLLASPGLLYRVTDVCDRPEVVGLWHMVPVCACCGPVLVVAPVADREAPLASCRMSCNGATA